jgi:hypothetical protein
MQKIMVPKCELFKSIPLHVQGLNYGEGVYELEDYVEEETLNSNLPKAWTHKKNSFCKFF